MAVSTELVFLVIAAAFAPPVLYLIIIRNVERFEREPWGTVFRVFLGGAIVSVLIALLLEQAFDTGLRREYELQIGASALTLFLVVVIAPVVEEFTKALAIPGARRQINEVEDGIIYGAAAGLGFSATENLFYEIAALAEGGGGTFLAVAFLRSVTSSFLHATATGIVGYGLARRYVERRMSIEVLPYLALAILLHAAFNLIASLQFTGAVLLILFISFTSIRWTLHRIRNLDRNLPTFTAKR